jgi:hypothetical protein
MNRVSSIIPWVRAVTLLTAIFVAGSVHARDILISGRVTDTKNNPVAGVNINFSHNTTSFKSITSTDGTYKLTIRGVFPAEPGMLETGTPYPVPFREQVTIPVITGSEGDIIFSVYDLAGRKLTESIFRSVTKGSYQLSWDGQSQSGKIVGTGIYIYAVTFKGVTKSGRLVKSGDGAGAGGTTLTRFMASTDPQAQSSGTAVILFETTASRPGFHTARFTDIAISGDTIINFSLRDIPEFPFITTADYIAVNRGETYLSLILKGINLGTAPPGFFPGEIAYAITPDMYESWIEMMIDAGFNSLRVYTLHPPSFYEKLAEYNQRNPDKPLYLFQGVWLDEPDDPSSQSDNNLVNRTVPFTASIREVVDCMHGNRSIAFRPGRAYGDYKTDISPWVAGYIIGREISPQEVQVTNQASPGTSGWNGTFFSIAGGTASELFATKMLDETVSYEYANYSVKRPVSMSSWPTLDPLNHPTETHTDEDIAHIDIMKISQPAGNKLLFASYHAYPYYPDFVSDEPAYRTYSDEFGPNSYLGYLTDLRNYYEGIPLIIGEFGVPSSWGDAHTSFSGMNHGGLSELQQGEYNIRMLRNVINAGCGGGFMFAWMDEWFKATWIVLYLEAYGTGQPGNVIPTRQLWHNLVSPEQNFGLITFDPSGEPVWKSYSISGEAGITTARAAHDNGYFYLELLTGQPALPGDTVLIAFDTYLANTGEGRFPSGETMPLRAEFLLEAVRGVDSVTLFVTEAYDMFGLTPRFNLSDQSVQKFRSTVTDGSPWKPMRWINNGFDGTIFDLGRLPAEQAATFSYGERTALAWQGNRLLIRLPWTLLYFHDPTQGRVIDGAESYDGGYNFIINSRITDGIAISLLRSGNITHTTDRYTWPIWLTIPQTTGRAKKSLEIITEGLKYIPGFAN